MVGVGCEGLQIGLGKPKLLKRHIKEHGQLGNAVNLNFMRCTKHNNSFETTFNKFLKKHFIPDNWINTIIDFQKGVVQ